MAAVRSLGLHEPTAIPFLIAENLLPPDPSEDQYAWVTSVDECSQPAVDDELVWTKDCVVWSRGGVVKRVFRLDLEKEEIRHALFTYFAGDETTETTEGYGTKKHAGGQSQASDEAGQSRDSKSNLGTTLNLDGHVHVANGATATADGLSRALVVILKTQAHIFFLAGNSHVIPLPFEVHSVFATPRGLLIQREIHEEDYRPYPAAPPNSFVSSLPTDFRASQLSAGMGKRPSLAASLTEYNPNSKKHANLPRAFSLMDPHSEMGLVLSNQSPRWLRGGSRSSGFDALDPADEIVYVSSQDELSQRNPTLANILMLVVTINKNTSLYTIWTARYKEDYGGPFSKEMKPDKGGTRSKRRSSHFGMGTGASTPAGRTSVGRDSLGPRSDNWNASSLSNSQAGRRTDEEEDLASKIGDDLGDIGVPSRSSRRVSSLLARADLASSQDRVAFSDLATGSQLNPMSHGSLRQSLGTASNYGSFSFNPKSSMRSTASGFLDAPVDGTLEELNNISSFEESGNADLRELTPGLPEQILLSKVESFTLKFSGGFHTPGQVEGGRGLRICTLRPFEGGDPQSGDYAVLAVCVADRDSKSMAVINLRADKVALPKSDKSSFKKAASGVTSNKQSLLVQAIGIQHHENVCDFCKVVDGEVSRLATLNETGNDQRGLQLQYPGSNPVNIEVPTKLMLYEPYGVTSVSNLVNPSREGSVNRVMTDSPLTITGLDHASLQGMFDIIDSQHRRHRLQIQMEPRNELVRKVLKTCRFVLRDSRRAADDMLVGWWTVVQWLRTKEESEEDLEWTAIVVVLFAIAIPFINRRQTQAPGRARRKKGLLRSSSGSYTDLESWEAMLEKESGSTGIVAPWMMSSCWSWVVEQDAENHGGGAHESAAQRRKPSKSNELNSSMSTFCKNPYLIHCIALAREFLQSRQGRKRTDSLGFLPTEGSKVDYSWQTALCSILVGIHLVREEQKLSISEAEKPCRPLGLLAPVLAQIGGWLGWKSWSWAEDAFYGVEMAGMDRWIFEDTQIINPDVPREPFAPPSIFSYLEDSWSQRSLPFLTLLDLVTVTDRTPRKSKLWQECFTITPRTLALNGFLSESFHATTYHEKVKLMYRWGLTTNTIETFPEGVSAPLLEAILQSQIHASTSWDSVLLKLIDRDDLHMSMNGNNSYLSTVPPQSAVSHDAVRDFHHISSSTLDIDTVNSFEMSAEADRLSVTRLIFNEDKRFVEATRLLNQSKAPVAECVPEPGWTDSNLLEAQKDIVQLVTLRTLSIPAGRGMISFSGRLPLLTEKLPIPSFSLQCVMKPYNVTVSAERLAFSEEKVCWAFFHNGVSTGLAISKASKGIDTSWILFNKPQELTNRHAGFLLALGLNGHLRSLAKWVAFKYLTPKHTMTSIGLLLGLSASYLGTMDTLITRLLSVHVTRMLPVGAAELNLSSLTQTAGIMGIGLLYCNSQHRRMSEVMLSEIENVEQEENSISREDMRDEGYRLASGFALGFINLAKGKDLKGMRDMHIVERLLAVAVGTKNVDFAHILDRSTAGATIALALIFMKTNDEVLAEKIDIPDTVVLYDYVRPDMFLLRTLAKHLILWDSIRPSERWFVKSLPKVYRHRYRLSGVRRLSSNDMPFFSIIAGLCFTLGLRFAGSNQTHVRDILVSYLDQFIRICRLPAVNYDERLAQNSIRNCQDVVALSAASVMAGTGDLLVFRRLRSLHGRVDANTRYGSHMAAHMAIGMLFLGGGSYTLGTSDLAVASLLCSFYPIFPATVLDNKCHLQAFRHLWVLAAEPRCLVVREIDTRRPIPVWIAMTMRDGTTRQNRAPCLLPELNMLVKVEVQSADHWPLVLDFEHNDQLRAKFAQGDQSVYLRRRSAYNTSESSLFLSTFSGISEAKDILPTITTSTTATAIATTTATTTFPRPSVPPSKKSLPTMLSSSSRQQSPIQSQTIWDWIFNLPSLQGYLDIPERALLTRPPPTTTTTTTDTNQLSATPWLRTSAIDAKLVLDGIMRAAISVSSTSPDGLRINNGDADVTRDGFWQLRLLFGWLDWWRRVEGLRDEGDGLWLRKAFIEEIRWRLWKVRVGG